MTSITNNLNSYLEKTREEMSAIQSESYKVDTEACAIEAKIRAIDPAKLGESRYTGWSEWLPNKFIDVLYSIKASWCRNELYTLETELEAKSRSFYQLQRKIERLEINIDQLQRKIEESKPEVPLTTPEKTALAGVATIAGGGILGLSAPITIGAAVVVGATTAAYNWWYGDDSSAVEEDPLIEHRAAGSAALEEEAPVEHTDTDNPAIGREVVSHFLKEMPAARNEQVATFLDKLCQIPEGSRVRQDGDTVEITLTKVPKLTLDLEQGLSAEQVRSLEDHYPVGHGVEIFAPAADVRIKDLKRFGSIGPKAWNGAKGGVQLSKTIKLRREGDTLHVEGVPNIKYVRFSATGEMVVKATTGWGVPLPEQTYPVEDYDLLVSFLSA